MKVAHCLLFACITSGHYLAAQSNPPPGRIARTPPTSGSLGENGISVGEAKVFDNRSLVLMLESLGDTLRTLQVIDQEPLRKSLGLLQGSKTIDLARNLEILAGGTPRAEDVLQNTTTLDGLVRSTTTNSLTEAGKITYSLQQFIEDKINEKLDNKSTKTTSERLPSAPRLPDLLGPVTGAPAFGQNPSDLLSDQVNLTYQIFNVRMALERSLSDRLRPDGRNRLQAVLGFNVSLDPPKDAENSAAVVEITVSAANGGPVSLVTLLPLERTYNSVALSTKSNAFGGSAVAKMVTVGYTERRRGQTFYLYRDHDTVSFERMMTNVQELTFHGSRGRFTIPYYDSANIYQVVRTSGGKGKTVLLVRRPDVNMAEPLAFGALKWEVEFEGAKLPWTFAAEGIRIDVPSDNPDGSFILFEPQLAGAPSVPRMISIPPATAKPKAAVEAKSAASLSLSQNDSTTLLFVGEKISEVSTVKIVGFPDITPSYDSSKKELSVPISPTLTASPAATLTLRFLDSSGKELASVNLEVKPSATAKGKKK